ncbi:MAG: MerR family transcriptional regulator [Alphaproteobacteria bacterium]|nr:MerR family transcriptional regulator [Alphaproteobacteria bacterium]
MDSARALRVKKAPAAFRTISEVADELHIPQHVLRFWETKFPQLRPLKRGGGRRYYRPEDIVLLRRISDWLYIQGYTIKGVQRLLREGGARVDDDPRAAAEVAEHETEMPESRAAAAGGPQLSLPGVPRPAAPKPAVRVKAVGEHSPARAAAAPAAAAGGEVQVLRSALSDLVKELEALRSTINRPSGRA